MLSVVIPTLNDEALLGRALHPLVAAAVSGFVREVIVADAGSTDATLEVADDAGCRILKFDGEGEGRIASAAAQARSDWVMVLRPGAQLMTGWEGAVRDHMERRPGTPAYAPMIDPAATGLGARLKAVISSGPRLVVVAPRQDVADGRPLTSARRLTACAVRIEAAR